MEDLLGGDAAALGAKMAASKKPAKPMGMGADEEEDDDMFADMVVDDLDTMDSGAGEPAAAEPARAVSEDAEAVDQPPAKAPLKPHRPPLHPGKPTAVAQPSEAAPALCKDGSSSELHEQQQQQQAAQGKRQSVHEVSAALEAALGQPSPSSSTDPSADDPVPAEVAGAVAAAVAAGLAAAPEEQEPAVDGAQAEPAAEEAPEQPMQLDCPPAPRQVAPPAAAAPKPEAAAPSLPARPAAVPAVPPPAAPPAPPAAVPKTFTALMGMAGIGAGKGSSVTGSSRAGAAAQPPLARPAAPAGAAAAAVPSRLGQAGAGLGLKPASFGLPRAAPAKPKAGAAAAPGASTPWQPPVPPPAVAALQQPDAQQQGTPGSALPKHMQASAAKGATCSPITPAGHPDQAQAAPAPAQAPLPVAALADDILRLDFGAQAASVLEGHEQLMGESAALSVPVADAAQEQLLVLDQLALQAEALRRKVSGLRVDVAIYRSSLAFMDSPLQARLGCATSFRDAAGRAEELWAPLAAYQPPAIELPPPPSPMEAEAEAGGAATEAAEASADGGAAQMQEEEGGAAAVVPQGPSLLAAAPQAESPDLELGGLGEDARAVQETQEGGSEAGGCATSPGGPCHGLHSAQALQAPKPKARPASTSPARPRHLEAALEAAAAVPQTQQAQPVDGGVSPQVALTLSAAKEGVSVLLSV